MPEIVKLEDGKELTKVSSPWWSKINLVQVITAVVALCAAFGIVIPDEWQRTVLELVAVIGPLVTMVLRTFFTSKPISMFDVRTAEDALKKAG